MHARKLIYTAIAAAFSLGTAGAYADTFEILQGQGTLRCTGKTLLGVTQVKNLDARFKFSANAVAGDAEFGYNAWICVTSGSGLAWGTLPENSDYCYTGAYFPDANNILKGTMGLRSNWSRVYPTYSETVQLKVEPEGRSQVRLEGKSIALGFFGGDTDSLSDAVSATCDWKLTGEWQLYQGR